MFEGVIKKVAHCHVCRHPGEWCPALNSDPVADTDKRWQAKGEGVS